MEMSGKNGKGRGNRWESVIYRNYAHTQVVPISLGPFVVCIREPQGRVCSMDYGKGTYCMTEICCCNNIKLTEWLSVHKVDWDKSQVDLIPPENVATSFTAPQDLHLILKELYELCPKFTRNENANAGVRKFLSASQHSRISVAVSPYIVVLASSILNAFVVEEVKAACKQGVKSLWEWTVGEAGKIVEIPDHIMTDPTTYAPFQWECVEKVFTSGQEWCKIPRVVGELTEKKSDNSGAEPSSLSDPEFLPRDTSVILEWTPQAETNLEFKDANGVTSLYEDIGETLSAVAVSLAFTKSLELRQQFSFPLSTNAKKLLPKNLVRLLAPGSLWEGGSDEIKKSLADVTNLMRESEAVPSTRLIAAWENLSTLCLHGMETRWARYRMCFHFDR